MPMVCALIGHRPDREPVFNDGFYFACCRGCGQDIVRTPWERWHRPRNARVVWSRTPPPSAREACLEKIRQGPLQPWSDLPAYTRISGTAAREIRKGMVAPTAAREARRSSIPDFMSDPEIALDPAAAKSQGEAVRGPRSLAARPIRVA